nr:TCDD inducible poly(ADP-ribose) polymerase [Rousettus aegyptiacus]
MNVYETTEFDQLRRLSTPPSSNVNSIYHTVWKFFCRDHFGWREYPESVIRLIEEANSRGLKEVRFMMWNNHYILHNSFFRREIKRRPLFRSCFILLPYLQ